MSDNIELRVLENPALGVNLEMILYKMEPYFIGTEVALMLGFKDPRSAIDRHIKSKYKTTLKELCSGLSDLERSEIFPNKKSNQILINELAFYNLCLRSNLPEIEPFQCWVHETIKDIRLGNLVPIQSQSLEDNPAAQIHVTLPQIPEYEPSGDNVLRKEMHDEYKEGFDRSKNKSAQEAGEKGGTKTQNDIRELKRYVRNSYFESKELLEKQGLI